MPSDASEFSASRSFILESIPSIAVMEAMPLQQFPLTCGKHEGSRPPFRHPQRYPPLADKLGNLFVMLQLQLVHNNMTRLGYSPAQCIKAVVSCGGPAARRFFAPGSIEGHGSLQADLAKILVTDNVSQLPCFKTFHPAAMVYKGYVALGGPGMGGIIASAFAPTSLAAKPPPAESFAAGGSAKAFLPSRSSFDLLLVFHSLALPIDVGGLVRWEGFAGLPFSVGLAAERALGDAVMALSAALCTADDSCSTS